MLTSKPPVTETQKGPNLSCSRPAKMNEIANTITAHPNTEEVAARFHPNSFSSGATNTLHAYSEPSSRFMESPPPTRHHRLINTPAVACALVAMALTSFVCG